ncbi:hypothetical protein COW53_10760 [bacterium CG17_big_fil_post_rev_8_21_14_2_50_64_8]|nr:MAG: hypothetical protein COW53_10760 [bacterium CG17_big_fil_post_rev_8_21_14_2_50_64_8]PJA76866.1 MAG: hypothetical protein CO151_01380 [bacterium CG_4_9_14_3_um_filter_65_15]
MRAPEFRHGIGGLVWCVLLLSSVILPRTGFGQLLYQDRLPWSTPADSTSRLALEVAADHFFDARFDWSVDRLLLTVVLPGGENGRFFVRMPHLTFDSGNTPVLKRWPDIEGEDLTPGWPGSGRVNGFGQLEAGALGQLKLPVLGPTAFGAKLGLPVGSENLYPFSSTSMPLQIEMRKTLAVAGAFQAHLGAGTTLSLGSGRAGLAEDAFSGGRLLGLELDWYRGRGSRVTATLDRRNQEDRTSLVAGLQTWFSWTPDGSLGLKAAREMEGPGDRPAQWFLTVAWRFDSAKFRPKPAEPSLDEDPATPTP